MGLDWTLTDLLVAGWQELLFKCVNLIVWWFDGEG